MDEGDGTYIPESVLDSYVNMSLKYQRSIGAYIDECVHRDTGEVVLRVVGSGGYSGESYYFSTEGREIVSSVYTDTPTDTPPKVDVDHLSFECSTIIRSR